MVKIKDVMNEVVAIEKDMTLKAAAKLMSDKNIGSLVVVNGDKILGIITERDILNNASNLGKSVKATMTKNVITINPYEELDNAAIIMKKHKIHRIPVVDEDKLAGIISSTDLIAHADELDEEFLFG
jgi:CBS domain-containing protein